MKNRPRTAVRGRTNYDLLCIDFSMDKGGLFMLMTTIFAAICAAAVIFGAAAGEMNAVSAAVSEGAAAAVELCVSITGALCLWSGFMELLRRAGIADALSRALAPLLCRIYPRSFADADCAAALSANFSANLLGLGNAATPAGIRAARLMSAIDGADRELCRLVVMNTASVQLLPATVAALRAAMGSETPFDILPCVWISSLLSVSAGLLVERLTEGGR